MQKTAAKPETITIRHLAATLADSHGLPKSKMNDMLAGMVDAITGHLKRGRRIRFNGLGILQVRKRAAAHRSFGSSLSRSTRPEMSPSSGSCSSTISSSGAASAAATSSPATSTSISVSSDGAAT